MPSLQDFINNHLSGSLNKSASEKEEEKKDKKKEDEEEKEDKKEKKEDKKEEDKKEEKKEEKKASTIEDAFKQAVSNLDEQTMFKLDKVAALQAINIAKHANIIRESVNKGGNMYDTGNGFAVKTASAATAGMEAIKGLKASAANKLRAAGSSIKGLAGAVDQRVMDLGNRVLPSSVKNEIRDISHLESQINLDDILRASPGVERAAGYGSIGAGLGAAGLAALGAYKGRKSIASGAKELYGMAGDGVAHMRGMPTRSQAAMMEAERAAQAHAAIQQANQEAYARSFSGRANAAYNQASDTLRQGAAHVMNAAKNPYVQAGVGAAALGGAGLYGYNRMTKEQSMGSEIFADGYNQALADLGIDVNELQKSANVSDPMALAAKAYVGEIFEQVYNENFKKEASLFEYVALGGE